MFARQPISNGALLSTVTAFVLALAACTGQPVASSASAGGGGATLASGTATFQSTNGDRTVEVDATGSGDAVSGTIRASDASGTGFTIGLECSSTADDGTLILGGEVSESTDDAHPQGSRAALVVRDGDPDALQTWFEDPPPADSCAEFLTNIPPDVISTPQDVTDGEITVSGAAS